MAGPSKGINKPKKVKSKDSKTKENKLGTFIKNSSTKLRKTFDVFNNKNHENQYATLESLQDDDDNDDDNKSDGSSVIEYNDYDDETPQDRKKRKHNEVVMVDDYDDDDGQDNDQDNEDRNDDLVLVDDEDDEENTSSVMEVQKGGKEEEGKEEGKEEKPKTGNDLDDNDDFISLKFLDSDEDDDNENENGELDNEEDAYSMDENETDLNLNSKTIKNDVPWIKNHDHSTQKEIADWLTLEIKDFIAYISPSREEIELRNNTVRRLRDSITSFWKDCEVHVFGSYATDLYLPGSDIDMVIVSQYGGYDSRNSLYSLASFLKKEQLATNVEVIAKAKVPIIKFTEAYSNIHIDVSFERTNGIDAARTIRSWLSETPGLREIVLIVKQFLSARKLNNVHVGGLGGYSIICLVYSFLQLHPRLSTGNISPYENLGVLLIEFFELYGKNFGYDNVAICVETDNVCYLNKKYYPDLQGRNPFTLSIQDPSDPSNNISRGSFNIRDIKKAFAGAYELLTNGCYDLESATFKQRIGKSILGNVVKYRGKERDFKDERELVINEALHEDSASIISGATAATTGGIIGTKTYFTEQDVTSSDDEIKSQPNSNLQKVSKNAKTSKLPKQNVDKLMGIDDETSDDDESIPVIKKKTSTSSLSKDDRRDFWLNKGKSLT